jgi:hypothetical protein
MRTHGRVEAQLHALPAPAPDGGNLIKSTGPLIRNKTKHEIVI